MDLPSQSLTRPLCVDLDGTLVQTDTLVESVLSLIKSKPWLLFLLPFWLLKGKAHFKHQLAQTTAIDVTILPYNPELLDFLHAERKKGRQIVLVTAANHEIAQAVAEHLDLFSQVLASNETINLKGRRKRDLLLDKFGATGFDYLANSKIDIPIWQAAKHAYIAAASPKTADIFSRQGIQFQRIFKQPTPSLRILWKTLRIHQWVKNILLFVPLLTAHKFTDILAVSYCMLGFLAFSFAASAGYLLNDLLDLPADRSHISKKHRPIAAGQIPLSMVSISAIFLLAVSGALAVLLPIEFAVLLAIYFVLTVTYSIRLKQVVALDVVILAGLYTLRLLAGGAAGQIPMSPWLLGFSMFLFLSLALLKRYSELKKARAANLPAIKGRGYQPADLEQVSSLGAASGYISVLVLALYINSAEVKPLYATPELMWLVCPFFIYWISRMWIFAHRGEVQEDPVVFALKDKISYLVGLGILGIMYLAI